MDVKKSNTEQWNSKLFRVINSALCFAIAYVLFNYLYWFAMVFAAKYYKLDSFVYYYGIKIVLNSSLWDLRKVTLIYSAGPVACLFLALVFLLLYRLLRHLPTLLNLFLLWGFVIGSGIFVAQALVIWLGIYNYGSHYYQGLAVVLSWWRVPLIVARLSCIPFVLLFVYLSLNYGKPFLLFSFSYSRVNKLIRKRKYFIEIAMVPFALGALIAIVFTFPMSIPLNTIYLIVIGLALVVAWYTLKTAQVLRNQLLRYTILQLPSIPVIILFVLVCLLIMATYGGMYIAI